MVITRSVETKNFITVNESVQLALQSTGKRLPPAGNNLRQFQLFLAAGGGDGRPPVLGVVEISLFIFFAQEEQRQGQLFFDSPRSGPSLEDKLPVFFDQAVNAGLLVGL